MPSLLERSFNKIYSIVESHGIEIWIMMARELDDLKIGKYLNPKNVPIEAVRCDCHWLLVTL